MAVVQSYTRHAYMQRHAHDSFKASIVTAVLPNDVLLMTLVPFDITTTKNTDMYSGLLWFYGRCWAYFGFMEGVDTFLLF